MGKKLNQSAQSIALLPAFLFFTKEVSMSDSNGDKLAKVSRFFKQNGLPGDASLINYFIKKFGNNMSNLSDVYQNIPKEERSDFIKAVDIASDDIDSIDDDDSDEHDYELNQIYEQMRSMHKKNPNLVMVQKDGFEVTIDDVLETLSISPEDSE